jgi:hypothetical protein
MALAQQAPPSSDAPASDSVGPKELQNFSLNGTVTHAADQQPAVQAAPRTRQPRPQAQANPSVQPSAQPVTTSNAQSASPAAPSPRRTEIVSREPAVSRPERAPEPLTQAPPSSSVNPSLPKLDADSGTASTPPAASAPPSPVTFAPDPASAGTLAPEHRFSLLPWLIAALALGAGGAFLFWRNRGREAFAGGPQIDAFSGSAPAVAPRPAPAPPAAAPEPPSPAPPAPGFVSTRLRPWVELGFHPLRCILDDERLTIEFEIELFNSGSAPARAVLAEASIFNAGATQDEEIAAFFANPVGEGERIVALPPLKRMGFKTQVTAPRAQLQAYALAGRQVFVPVIAFNVLYGWSGGEGQTSVSYLLGRDTSGEKMAPFRLDLGPRIFRGIAARLLQTGVRR